MRECMQAQSSWRRHLQASSRWWAVVGGGGRWWAVVALTHSRQMKARGMMHGRGRSIMEQIGQRAATAAMAATAATSLAPPPTHPK